jgi:hypothetical protein
MPQYEEPARFREALVRTLDLAVAPSSPLAPDDVTAP